MLRTVEQTRLLDSSALQKTIDAHVAKLEAARDLSRIWVVVDMVTQQYCAAQHKAATRSP